jgi:hypothetical protein
MKAAQVLLVLGGFLLPGAADPAPSDPFDRPAAGSARLDVLSPTVLELSVFDALDADDRPPRWDFVDDRGRHHLPPPAVVVVRVDDRAVRAVVRGFRRRALHVPPKRGPLLLGSSLIVALSEPVPEGAAVSVVVTDPAAPRRPVRLEARAEPLRRGLAVHVSQAGFAPDWSKRAFVGRYLGDAGELAVDATAFSVVDARDGAPAFRGTLAPRRDVGYDYPAYQGVLEADFSAFAQPGTWRVVVSGLGASEPFVIGEAVARDVARVFGLGLYHQRCGADLGPPTTRFAHPACHRAPASIPTASSASVLERAGLATLEAARFAFVKKGAVDVSGGHHDAGDYGKYVATSAQMIGALVFAVDALPGLAGLDDLGLPESGDGAPDLLQIAAREAAFLARMQDDDGGFYTLVQPRDRAYEGDRLPQHGDPQAVFPKSTVATAAAVAALAQLGASPRFRALHPTEAEAHVAAALRGWSFLERAWERYGRAGAFQEIHHYGKLFDDADEIAWAATELFLATGSPAARREAEQALRGRGDAIRRWGWWRLFEGWGGAFRACAFAAVSGRARAFDDELTAICRAEVLAGAADVAERVAASAYGTALPLQDKRFRTVGWFFSTDAAFDLLAGLAQDDQPAWRAAWQACLAFETGGNPADVSFVSGLGRRNFQEIVHQVAQNDDEAVPPSGLPIGNLLPGIPAWTPLARHAATLTWPSDDDATAPYAPYDRATDVFAPNAEPVTARMARSLIGAAFLLAARPPQAAAPPGGPP